MKFSRNTRKSNPCLGIWLMNREELWRLCHIIQYTFFLIVTVTTFSMAEDNSSIPQDNNSDWIGVIIGVIVPALILVFLGAIIYAKWNQKRKQDEEPVGEHGLRATSTSKRLERNSSIPDEELWEVDESVSTLEEISLNALQNATRLYEANKIREYYAAISSIIKRYVGAKFNIKASNATTGEILENLPQNLTESTIDHVGEILRICDIVEFAQYRPSNDDLEHIHQLAVEFIENQIEIVESENSEVTESEDSEPNELDEIYEQFRKLQKQRWK